MQLAYLHYLCNGQSGLNHVHQFAQGAEALGHPVTVCAMNLAPETPSERTHSRPATRLREAIKKRFGRYLHEPKELLWNLRYIPRETTLVRSIRPDVLIVRGSGLSCSCTFVARRLDVPLVLEINAPVMESRLYFGQYWHIPAVPEWLEEWTLRRADALTVVSGALMRYFVDRYRLPESKFTIVPNGADTLVFRPGRTCDPEVRKRLAHGTVIGFVGSFQKFHGSEALSRMALEVGTARPSVRFLFVGDGPGLEEVRQATSPLRERAHFVGKVPHERVPGLVGCMDIGVMPETNSYGSPLKVLEWMAAGRAVVAPRVGPLEELIEDGVHGVLFPQGDIRALIEAILMLIDNPERARRMGAAAAEKVRSSLTWTHNAERVLSACERARIHHREAKQKPRLPSAR